MSDIPKDLEHLIGGEITDSPLPTTSLESAVHHGVDVDILLGTRQDDKVMSSERVVPVRRADGGFLPDYSAHQSRSPEINQHFDQLLERTSGMAGNYDVQVPTTATRRPVPAQFAELVDVGEVMPASTVDAAKWFLQKTTAVPMTRDGLIDYNAQAAVLCKSADRIPSKATIGDDWWRSRFGKTRTPEASAKCVTEFYRKYFTACENGDYDLARHYLKEMSSC